MRTRLLLSCMAVVGTTLAVVASARERTDTVAASQENDLHAAGKSLVPLNTLAVGAYRGFTGGLYTDGRNEPHGAQIDALGKMSAAIQPLDKGGKPDLEGKIIVVALGALV